MTSLKKRAKKRRGKSAEHRCSRLLARGLVPVDKEFVEYLHSLEARVVVIQDRKINFQKFFAKPQDIKAARALAAIVSDRPKCCCVWDRNDHARCMTCSILQLGPRSTMMQVRDWGYEIE